MFKKGDKILIEATFTRYSELDGTSVRCTVTDVDEDFDMLFRAEKVRPWTEPPVTVLWRDENGGEVLSDGSVLACGGPACAEIQAKTLAAYVRHLGAK